MKTMDIMGKRPRTEADTTNRWVRVGVATVLDDGNILLRINAIPLNWDGELKLVEPKSKKSED